MARKKQPKQLTNKEINQARKLSRELDLLTEDTPKELIDDFVKKTGTKIGRMKDPKKIVSKVKANHNKFMTTHGISKPLKRGHLNNNGRYVSEVNPNYTISKEDFDAYEKEVEKARKKLNKLKKSDTFGMIFGEIPYSTTSKGKPLYNSTLDNDYLMFKHTINEALSPVEMRNSSWLNNRMDTLKRFNSKGFSSNYVSQIKENLIKGLTETSKTTVIGKDEADKITKMVKNMTQKEIVQFTLIVSNDGNDLFKIIYEESADDILDYMDKLYSQASSVKRVQAQQRRLAKIKEERMDVN